ncbi:MAG: transcription termination/antitermination protein NusG [Rhodomicrobium sp.]
MTEPAKPQGGVWLVAATHPHRETQAVENLERQSFHVYCPMTAKHIRHARRAYDALRPLFPGYIFVEQPQLWRPLLSTIGVRAVVMSDDRPAKLPAGFVESLRAREVDGCICKPEAPFQIGQQVTIQGGPFDGLIGQIMEMRPNDRILVLLDLLKRQTPVHIDAKRLAT